MIKKEIDTSENIHEIIATRWSGVSYDPARTVSEENLLSIMEAARWAPSCFGDQPWRYIVCNRCFVSVPSIKYFAFKKKNRFMFSEALLY